MPWTCGTQRIEYGSWTLCGLPVVSADHLRVAQQVAQLGRDARLAGMGTSLLVCGREGHVRAHQRLGRHRRDDARRGQQPLGMQQHERADRGHLLRPVEQREAFLCLELEWLKSTLRKRLCATHGLAINLRPSSTDDRQREVGQWREIPGRAD